MAQIEIPVTLSGAIVTAEDATARNFINLVTDIDPVQDLHGYDSPWPAGGGKNLLDVTSMTQAKTNNGITATPNGDGTFALSGTAESADINIWLLGNYDSQVTLFTLPAGTYTVSNVRLFNYHSGLGTVVPINGSAQYTFSEDQPITAVRVGQAVIGTNYTGTTLKPQIEKGSSPTSYSPYSNVCPISGHSTATVTRTGINIWDEEWENGTIDVNTGQDSYNPNQIRSKGYTPCIPNTSYYFVRDNVAGNIFEYDSSKNFIRVISSPTSFTTSANAAYLRFYMASAYGTTYNNNIAINYPSTDTAYHAGHIQTVTIALGSTYYGAQLDAVAGTLTVDKAMVTFDGSNDEVINDASSPNAYRARIEIPSDSITWTSASTKTGKLLSNEFEEITNDDSYNGDVGIHYRVTGTHEIVVGFDSMGVSQSNIRTWLASNLLVVVYELATPTVITGLTPAQVQALVGTNNVWSDTGNTLLTYYRSVEMALSTMYPAKNGSPKTTLSADITASATSMALDDTSVLPPAPNLAVLGEESSAEIILYNDITGNVVSGMVRGINGTTASAWNSGTAVARNYTSYDHDTIINNILSLDEDKANVADEIMYFSSQACSAVTNAEIFRITNDAVTTDTVVLECTFSKPSAITSNLSWQSYSGYIAFTGTCTDGTCTANVTLGLKGN